MSDSSFVVKLALIKIIIKPAKSHHTLKDGSACVCEHLGLGTVLTRFSPVSSKVGQSSNYHC